MELLLFKFEFLLQGFDLRTIDSKFTMTLVIDIYFSITFCEENKVKCSTSFPGPSPKREGPGNEIGQMFLIWIRVSHINSHKTISLNIGTTWLFDHVMYIITILLPANQKARIYSLY